MGEWVNHRVRFEAGDGVTVYGVEIARHEVQEEFATSIWGVSDLQKGKVHQLSEQPEPVDDETWERVLANV